MYACVCSKEDGYLRTLDQAKVISNVFVCYHYVTRCMYLHSFYKLFLFLNGWSMHSWLWRYDIIDEERERRVVWVLVY